MSRCRVDFKRIALQESESGCTIEWSDLVDSPAIKFHQACIDAVRSSAEKVAKDLAETSEDGKM